MDYSNIRAENELRYGTDIGRLGPMLLSDRYPEQVTGDNIGEKYGYWLQASRLALWKPDL